MLPIAIIRHTQHTNFSIQHNLDILKKDCITETSCYHHFSEEIK